MQLVHSCRDWRRRLHDAGEELVPLNGSGRTTVQLIAKTPADRCRRREVCLRGLAELVGSAPTPS